MKISCVSEKITVIELSASEVDEYSISFCESDYNSASKRSTLWALISEAERLLGKHIYIENGIEIDFMPDIKGGCLLIISESEREDISFSKCVIESDNSDNILDFAKALPQKGKYPSSLYTQNNNYRIIAEDIDDCFLALSSEFDLEILYSESAAESTKEHYLLAVENRALEILGGFFTHN